MAEAPATRRPRIAPKVRRMPNSRLDAEACRVRALRMVRYLKREHGICLTKKNGQHRAVKPRKKGPRTLTAAQAAGLAKGQAMIRARADRLRGTGKGKKRKATAPATTVNIDAAATALMGLGS